MTAVAKWLGLWCMELWVLGSSFGSDFDLFFFLSQKISKFFGGLMVLYVMVL